VYFLVYGYLVVDVCKGMSQEGLSSDLAEQKIQQQKDQARLGLMQKIRSDQTEQESQAALTMLS
jgi:hypothetical protein